MSCDFHLSETIVIEIWELQRFERYKGVLRVNDLNRELTLSLRLIQIYMYNPSYEESKTHFILTYRKNKQIK